MLIAPVTTGEPISTGILTGVAAIIGSLFQVFGGGVPRAVKTALEALRAAVTREFDALRRLWCIISRALGKVLNSLHTIWTRVLWPLLRQVPRVIGRLRRLIERDLPRVLRLIERIREKVLWVYERFVGPVLTAIQRMRKLILILRLLHIHWGDKLDARLVKLQGQILAPLKAVLEHLSIVEQWVNAIVTAEQLFQEVIFGRSVYHYQDSIVRGWWAGMNPTMSEREKLELWPARGGVRAEESAAGMRQYLTSQSGPVAADGQKAAAEFRAMIGRA